MIQEIKEAMVSTNTHEVIIKFKGDPAGWPDISELFDSFKGAVLAQGYQPATFQREIDELASESLWITQDEEEEDDEDEGEEEYTPPPPLS